MGNRNATCDDCGGRKPNGGALRCRSCSAAARTLDRGVCWWGTCTGREYVIKSGLCQVHYDRAKRGIDMDLPMRGGNARRGVDPCAIDACSRLCFHGPTGYCSMHYSRFRTHGEPGQPDPLPTGDSTRWHVDSHGYIRRRRWDSAGKRGDWESQHRFVMEEHLGRPLERHENVHHINGIKTDNRIDNLELWVKPQPCGQRPSDLVEWVVEHYPELVDATLNDRSQLRLVV